LRLLEAPPQDEMVIVFCAMLSLGASAATVPRSAAIPTTTFFMV
jgi:hypothetical protein